MKTSSECDGNLKEAPPLPERMVVEMGEGFEGLKTKMSSKGQEIILKRREGFLTCAKSMTRESREPNRVLYGGRKGWLG